MRVVTLPDGAISANVLAAAGSPLFLGTEDLPPGGGVQSVVAGTGIAVDSSDPANPVVSSTILAPYAAVLRIATATDVIVPVGASPDVFVRSTPDPGVMTIDQSGALFTLGTLARATYAGPTRPALVQLNTCLEIAAANNESIVSAAIDLNGDTLGESQFSDAAYAGGQNFMWSTSTAPAAGFAVPICCARLVTLASGDILSPSFCVHFQGGATDVACESITMSILLL
jgi:hypothetical protein